MLRKLNIGIIGLGEIGKLHMNNCLNLNNVNLLAVADTSRKARQIAKNNGVKNTYKDYNELLDKSNIDAVIISLPNYLHKDCSIKASENGINILMEKPLARNEHEGRDILSSVRKNGINFMMAYPLRVLNI